MPTPLSILYIEDDPDDVDLLRGAFEDTGNQVSIKVIKEGHKALPWLHEQEMLPEIIVMDLNLPKMHGREILAEIKADDKLKNIPLVVLTTSSSKDDMRYCLDNGAREFIPKPATVQGFREAVALIISAATK